MKLWMLFKGILLIFFIFVIAIFYHCEAFEDSRNSFTNLQIPYLLDKKEIKFNGIKTFSFKNSTLSKTSNFYETINLENQKLFSQKWRNLSDTSNYFKPNCIKFNVMRNFIHLLCKKNKTKMADQIENILMSIDLEIEQTKEEFCVDGLIDDERKEFFFKKFQNYHNLEEKYYNLNVLLKGFNKYLKGIFLNQCVVINPNLLNQINVLYAWTSRIQGEMLRRSAVDQIKSLNTRSSEVLLNIIDESKKCFDIILKNIFDLFNNNERNININIHRKTNLYYLNNKLKISFYLLLIQNFDNKIFYSKKSKHYAIEYTILLINQVQSVIRNSRNITKNQNEILKDILIFLLYQNKGDKINHRLFDSVDSDNLQKTVNLKIFYVIEWIDTFRNDFFHSDISKNVHLFVE